MQHGTHAAPEVGVDELPCTLPPEVLVVEGVVLVQYLQVLGQFPGGGEVVHVDVGVGWGCPCVVFRASSHNDGDNVAAGKRKMEKVNINVSFYSDKFKKHVVQHVADTFWVSITALFPNKTNTVTYVVHRFNYSKCRACCLLIIISNISINDLNDQISQFFQ